MNDRKLPEGRLMMHIDGKEIELDPAKWETPATRGDLFAAVQHIRHLVFLAARLGSDIASEDADSAQTNLNRMRDKDDQLSKLIVSLISKDDSP